MIPEEYMPMVKALSDQTKSSKLEWETTSDKEKFILNIAQKSITIWRFLCYPEDQMIVKIEILDFLGETIDSFQSMDNEEDFPIMDKLFGLAKRNALKIQETIDEIMRELNF